MQPLSFIVPGFSKCGTTTLCSLLDQHPDIYIPPIKEPNFFNREDYDQHWGEYQQLFENCGPATRLGEGSTFYTTVKHEQEARERIKRHYPDIKLIFIARDPIKRIESSFRESHHSSPRFGFDTPFDTADALREMPVFIDDTRYWTRLNNYREHFPKQNIHILFLEDLTAQTGVELQKCFRFLGVDPEVKIQGQSRQLNAGTSKLYDSRLLRRIRNNRFTGIPLSKVSIDTQDRIFSKLGLRRTFKKPISLHAETRHRLLSELESEMASLLDYAGKPLDFWPRYHQLLLDRDKQP